MLKNKRIVFFGTGGTFSNIVLKNIHKANIDIYLVIILVPNNSSLIPLNESYCVQNNIEYWIVNTVNQSKFLRRFAQENIDLSIVASFSEIIGKEIIMESKDGFINIHPSALPNYRGPNPIFWQIRDLKDIFGITIHNLTERIDKGEILAMDFINCKDILFGNEILVLLAEKGSELIIKVLVRYIKPNKLRLTLFNLDKFKKEDGFYNKRPSEKDFELNLFDYSPYDLKKMVSRLSYWGNCFFYFRGDKAIIESISIVNNISSSPALTFLSDELLNVSSKHGSFNVMIETKN